MDLQVYRSFYQKHVRQTLGILTNLFLREPLFFDPLLASKGGQDCQDQCLAFKLLSLDDMMEDKGRAVLRMLFSMTEKASQKRDNRCLQVQDAVFGSSAESY